MGFYTILHFTVAIFDLYVHIVIIFIITKDDALTVKM